MIRGYVVTRDGTRRPFVHAVFRFPNLSSDPFEVRLLIDTGADRTVVAPLDAHRLERQLAISLSQLPEGLASTGVGGQVSTRVIPQSQLTLDGVTWLPLTVTLLEPPARRLPWGHPPAIPSLLGRDIISRFALFLNQASDKVRLLEREETVALKIE